MRKVAAVVAILAVCYGQSGSAQNHIEHCDSLLKASYGNIPMSSARAQAKYEARISPKTADGQQKCIDYYNGKKVTRMYLYCKARMQEGGGC